jgi:type II secretory pathway pseudopilin PulG
MVSKHITAVRRWPITRLSGPPGFRDRPTLWLGTGGFTLIDNLLTLGLMMVTMLALVGLLGAVISANATNKKHAVAMGLAELKIADTRRLGYNNSLGANQTVTEGYNAAGGTPMAPYPNFKRETVTQVNTPSSGMQTVTVTVYWDQDKRFVRKSIQVAQ